MGQIIQLRNQVGYSLEKAFNPFIVVRFSCTCPCRLAKDEHPFCLCNYTSTSNCFSVELRICSLWSKSIRAFEKGEWKKLLGHENRTHARPWAFKSIVKQGNITTLRDSNPATQITLSASLTVQQLVAVGIGL